MSDLHDQRLHRNLALIHIIKAFIFNFIRSPDSFNFNFIQIMESDPGLPRQEVLVGIPVNRLPTPVEELQYCIYRFTVYSVVIDSLSTARYNSIYCTPSTAYLFCTAPVYPSYSGLRTFGFVALVKSNLFEIERRSYSSFHSHSTCRLMERMTTETQQPLRPVGLFVVLRR